MKYLFTMIIAMMFGVAQGQSFTYPAIKAFGRVPADFVPAGWVVLDTASGDLNKDGLRDEAVIIQKRDSIALVNDVADTVLTKPRMLLVLFKKADNSFELAEQSNSFILKDDKPTMEEPYDGIAIAGGALNIRFNLFANAGSWYMTNATYKFRYQQGQFVLIGADKSSLHRATHDFEDYSYNFLTGKRSYAAGNDLESTRKTSLKKIRVYPFKTLKTFLAPFTWEVEPDHFL